MVLTSECLTVPAYPLVRLRLPTGYLCRCGATGESEILQIYPASVQSSCKQFLMYLAVPDFRPVLSRQRIFHCNPQELPLFHPGDRLIVSSVVGLDFSVVVLVIKFLILQPVFKLLLSGSTKNLCQCIAKINNPLKLLQAFVNEAFNQTAKQLFGYEQVAKADCEYPIDYTVNA